MGTGVSVRALREGPEEPGWEERGSQAVGAAFPPVLPPTRYSISVFLNFLSTSLFNIAIILNTYRNTLKTHKIHETLGSINEGKMSFPNS